MPAWLVYFYYNTCMQKIKLIHNPNAGNGAYSKSELVSIIESAGYQCDYSSSKKEEWKEMVADTDMIIVAGGDGTVRKLAKAFLNNKKMNNDIPIGLLNLGTANNLIRTLRIKGEPGELIEAYKKEQVKKFDTGIIKDLPGCGFFLESCGFGIFPRLMKEMRKTDIHDTEAALQVMIAVIKSSKTFHCQIKADDKEIEGDFILAEIMNSPWMGPGLHMNSVSDPGDGKLELVLVGEDEREVFTEFVSGKLKEGSGAFSHHPVQCEKISIKTTTSLFHADDELIKLENKNALKIRTEKGFLNFMI